MTKKWCMLLCLSIIFVCAGCGKKQKEVDITTFSIEKDGSIQHTIVESFGDEFDSKELEAMLQSELNSYGKSKATPTAGDVKCDEVTVKDGQIKVVMDYPSGQDFYEFNNINAMKPAIFFFGTIEEAYAEGYDLDIILHQIEDDSVLLERDDLLHLGDKNILIYDSMINYDSEQNQGAPVKFHFYTNIYASSDNVVIEGKKDARINETDNLAYIILDK